MKRARLFAWFGGLALVALHLDWWRDWWRPQRAVLHLGWVPEELAWRLAWMGLAWLYLLFVLRCAWTEDEAGD